MRRRYMMACFVAAFATLMGANARADETSSALCAPISTSLKQVGRGVLTFAFLDIYEATLHAPEGAYHPDAPFSLTLHYFREFHGKDIAERSMLEMRKQAPDDDAVPDDWQIQLERILPDVKAGDELTAHFTPKGGAVFCRGETYLGTLHNPEAARRFADIWLSERTSEPHLRKQLLRLP